ncbi:MAG: metallophosphoesterase [Deltaproteobacteria bacterium]|nr:metallophosphoesterase [Deltaproteobacteria bacterium]
MPVIVPLLAFLTVASLIWGTAHWYVGRRVLRPLELPGPKRRRAWRLIIAAAAVGPLTMVSARFIADAWWITPLRWVSYIYMGFFSVLFALSVVRDLAFGAERLVRRMTGAEAPDSARRRFLLNGSNAAFLGTSGVLSGFGLYEAHRVPEVVEVDVPVPGLVPGLEGYRIAQISDIHIGATIKGPWLREVVARVNGLDADLIAVTGDLVDGSVAERGRDVAPIADLAAPDGVYFVTGNHEYYSGVLEWCDEVARLGLTVLNNAHRVVERGDVTMVVGGVTDFRADRHLESHQSDPDAALAGAPPADFKLLLAHQPKSIVGAARAGFDLQLSGHTHGGQFFPWSLFVGLAHPFTEGLGLHDRTHIYVNRGTGYWGPPHRAGVPSEITLLRLVAA